MLNIDISISTLNIKGYSSMIRFQFTVVVLAPSQAAERANAA
jgi:hypothetical protein